MRDESCSEAEENINQNILISIQNQDRKLNALSVLNIFIGAFVKYLHKRKVFFLYTYVILLRDVCIHWLL